MTIRRRAPRPRRRLPPRSSGGPHHQVDEAVSTDGDFHEFTVSSAFGSFQTAGRTQLVVRIQEVAALAALEDVSKTNVFQAADGQSVVKIGQKRGGGRERAGRVREGAGRRHQAVRRESGRRTQRAVESTGDVARRRESRRKRRCRRSAAKSVLGVSAAMRRWARKVGVDPYTTNSVLQKASRTSRGSMRRVRLRPKSRYRFQRSLA